MPNELPARRVRVRGRGVWRVPLLVAAHAQGAGTPRALIVGGGPAGDAVAAGLRDAGFVGDITLIGSEPETPYERPHLSKGYLMGTVARDRLPLRPFDQYRVLQAELLLGERVVDLDVERRAVELESGRTLGWDLLCIATGSDARRLDGALEPAPLPTSLSPSGERVPMTGPMYLRELSQADRLRALIDRGEPLDIIGAGFIGCEVAAVAVQKQSAVRMHEALRAPLVRVLGPELGTYLASVHREHGVDLRLNVDSPPRIEGAVLVAVGSAPRTGLAEKAELEVDRGIVVDASGRTPAPGVFAAGDVTRFYSPLYDARIRVEHFQTAQRQGFAVGRAMAGATDPYDEAPWFWSDQYDLNIQYTGAGLEWDEIVTRGQLGKPPFTVFYLSGGRLVAAAGVNDHHTVARTRRVLESRRSVSVGQLADPTFDLRRVLA